MTIFWWWLFVGDDFFLVMTIFWWWLFFGDDYFIQDLGKGPAPDKCVQFCSVIPSLCLLSERIFPRFSDKPEEIQKISSISGKKMKTFQLYVQNKFPGKCLYLSPCLVFPLVLPQAMNEMRLQKYCGFWSNRTLPYFPLSVRSSVIGVTYQLFSIFWRFLTWKPYIFWMHII